MLKNRRRFHKRQLYMRLQALVMLFCIATMSVFMLTYSARVQTDVYADYQNIGMSSLNSLMHAMNIIFSDVQDVSMQLFQDGSVHRFLYEEAVRKYDTTNGIVNKAKQVMVSNRYIDSVYIAAMDRGVVYASNYGLNTFEQTPDSEFISWFYNSRALIEIEGTRRVIVRKYDGLTKDVITVYARLPMGTLNYARGVLVINLDAATIYDSIMKPVLEGNDSRVYVLDDDGRIIISPDADGLYCSFDEMGMLNSPLEGEEGARFAKMDGQEYLVVYNTDANQGWRYVSMHPISRVRQTLRQQTSYMLLVCMAMLVVVYFISSRIAKLAVNPADELINLVRERMKNEDESERSLVALREELSRHFTSSDQMKTQLEEAVDALRDRLLLNLINMPNCDEAKARKGFEQYHIGLTGHCMQLALLGFEFDSAVGPIASDLTGLTAIPMIEYFFERAGIKCACVVGGLGEVVMLMETEPSSEAADNVLEEIIAWIHDNAGVRGCVSFYDVPFELHSLHYAYRQTRAMQDYRDLYDPGELLCFSDIHDAAYPDYHYAYDREDALRNCVRAGSLGDALYALDALIEAFGRQSHLSQANILLFNVNLYTSMMRLTYEQNLPVAFISRYSDQASVVQRIRALEQTRAFFEKMIREIIETTALSRQSRQDRRLEEIHEYIENNYAREELSLELASREMNISGTSINQILRAREDTTFTQQLVKTRIARACELLKNTDMKVQEIALAVGYSGANYFVRSFKAAMGVTPGKYKEGNYDS